jgi:hypothetical protein
MKESVGQKLTCRFPVHHHDKSEVKLWLEHANEYSRKFDGFNPPWLTGLKSIAETWLNAEVPEKMVPKHGADDYADGWNAAIDAMLAERSR